MKVYQKKTVGMYLYRVGDGSEEDQKGSRNGGRRPVPLWNDTGVGTREV